MVRSTSSSDWSEEFSWTSLPLSIEDRCLFRWWVLLLWRISAVRREPGSFHNIVQCYENFSNGMRVMPKGVVGCLQGLGFYKHDQALCLQGRSSVILYWIFATGHLPDVSNVFSAYAEFSPACLQEDEGEIKHVHRCMTAARPRNWNECGFVLGQWEFHCKHSEMEAILQQEQHRVWVWALLVLGVICL